MKNRDILIWGEILNGELDPTAFEILSIGKKLLKNVTGKISVFLIGHNLWSICEQLDMFGADRIYRVDDPKYKTFNSPLYLETLRVFCESKPPLLLIMGHTLRSLKIAPNLATALNTSLIMDCFDLEIISANGSLLCKAKSYNSEDLPVFSYGALPLMITVRKGMFPRCEKTMTKTDVVTVGIELSSTLPKS